MMKNKVLLVALGAALVLLLGSFLASSPSADIYGGTIHVVNNSEDDCPAYYPECHGSTSSPTPNPSPTLDCSGENIGLPGCHSTATPNPSPTLDCSGENIGLPGCHSTATPTPNTGGDDDDELDCDPQVDDNCDDGNSTIGDDTSGGNSDSAQSYDEYMEICMSGTGWPTLPTDPGAPTPPKPKTEPAHSEWLNQMMQHQYAVMVQTRLNACTRNWDINNGNIQP